VFLFVYFLRENLDKEIFILILESLCLLGKFRKPHHTLTEVGLVGSIKVASTIADLETLEHISPDHIAEAIQ